MDLKEFKAHLQSRIRKISNKDFSYTQGYLDAVGYTRRYISPPTEKADATSSQEKRLATRRRYPKLSLYRSTNH